MAAEAKPEPGLLRRSLQKARESWRRAGAIDERADKARRAYEAKADKYRGEGGHGGVRRRTLSGRALLVVPRAPVALVEDKTTARKFSGRASGIQVNGSPAIPMWS
jgi:hypothetical protein